MIVLASGRLRFLGCAPGVPSRSRFQRSLFEECDEDQGLQERFPALAKRARRESGEIALSSTRCGAIGDLRNEPHFELDVQQFFVIEGSCRSRPALEELDVQQFFVIEGSCRSRPALEELDGQQFFAVEGSCRRKISKWKSRAQVAESCLKVRRVVCVTNTPVPQGTTALSTPPFVRAGYDSRNNTTVLRRPEAVGWAPLVCAGPLTTSLRGLWVSGLLPPGNGGTNEGAATPKPTVRHKRGRRPKNRPAKGGTL